MSALSVAVVNKEQVPIYMKQFQNDGSILSSSAEDELSSLFGVQPSQSQSDSCCSTKHQFLFHQALDRVEQLSGPPPGYAWKNSTTNTTSGADAMYMGLLGPSDELRVYGYMTTTQILFLVIVQDDTANNTDNNEQHLIQGLLANLHRLYIADLQNPFKHLSNPNITSQRFDQGVQKLIGSFNQGADL